MVPQDAMRCDGTMMMVVVVVQQCREGGGRKNPRFFVLEYLNDNSRVVHPRSLHIERDHLRYRHEVLATKRTTQQPERQVLPLLHALLLRVRLPFHLGIGLGPSHSPSLSDAQRPIGHHVCATCTVVQLTETVRGEYEEGAGAESSVDDIWLGRNVRRRSIPGEEGLPGRWVCHAWV